MAKEMLMISIFKIKEKLDWKKKNDALNYRLKG